MRLIDIILQWNPVLQTPQKYGIHCNADAASSPERILCTVELQCSGHWIKQAPHYYSHLVKSQVMRFDTFTPL